MQQSTTIQAGELASYDERFLGWLRDHGIEPNDTFRVDVEGDQITVHQYDRNSEGSVYRDRAGDVALRDPFVVPLKRRLPELV